MKPVRTYAAQFLLLLSLILLLVIAVLIIYLHINLENLRKTDSILNMPHDYKPLPVMYLLLLKTAFAFIAGLSFRNIFRKTSSPELFFFTIAITALSFTAFRGMLILEPLFSNPLIFSETLTRVAYYGKFIISMSLFSSGLFSTGLAYQKQNSFLLMIILVSFVLSTVIPIDIYRSTIILLKGSGSEYGVNIVLIILQALAVLNFIMGDLRNNNHDYLFLAAGSAMVSTGNELMFRLVPGAASYGGLILLAGGVILFGYKIHKIYQWI